MSKFLLIINSGVELNPCPTVPCVLAVPVHFTILNPFAVFAFTVLGIVPSKLDCQVLPAFHPQAIKEFAEPFTLFELVPSKVNPFVSKDVILVLLTLCASA